MNIKKRLFDYFLKHKRKDSDFNESEILTNFKGNKVLIKDTVLSGKGSIFFRLSENVCLKIEGEYDGEITGTRNNIVLNEGEFEGMIQVE